MIDLKSAKELGRAAFHQGIKCAPCLDKSLMQHISPGIGENAQIYQAWAEGWTTENLKEVGEPYDSRE